MKRMMIMLATITGLLAGKCEEYIQKTITQDGITWYVTIEDNKITSIFPNDDPDAENVGGQLVIPAYLDGMPVVSIGGLWAQYSSWYTSILIPSTVTDLSCNWGNAGVLSIEVDAQNKFFCSQDGVVFDKECKKLVMYPMGRKGAYQIPSSVTSIGDFAFSGCGGLTGVTIPSSVTSIGEAAFSNCSGLMSFSVDSGSKYYMSVDGVLFNKSKTEVVAFPCGKDGFYEIPSSVTSIGDCAFYWCEGLTGVTIPSSVTSIGEWAFDGCSGLTNVTIPSSVTSIGESSFAFCVGLESITIPSSVTSIGDYAFNLCEGLDTVYVNIGDSARVRKLLEDSDPYQELDMDAIQFVEIDIPSPSPSRDDGLTADFDETVKHTFNGLVYDSVNVMCGMVQITTGKATAKGVAVGGFVILSDGKKQTIKSATGTVIGGYLTATTSVGKLGSMEITVGGNGFKGTLGDMTLATEETDEDTGILSGTLKLSYFDAKTGKVKTKSITIGGVASGGEAVGTATVKGQAAKSFAAEVE